MATLIIISITASILGVINHYEKTSYKNRQKRNMTNNAVDNKQIVSN